MVCEYKERCGLSVSSGGKNETGPLTLEFEIRYCRESAFAILDSRLSNECPHYKALERITELERQD